MCDFAPRQSYDINAAILDVTIATTGLFTPWPCTIGETVILFTDPPQTPPAAVSSTPAQPFPDGEIPRAGAAAALEGEGGR